MTVSTVVDHNDYTGNGVTISFPYTFRIFKKTDLAVLVVDLNENITVLTLDTDYTVTNAGGYNGGNVVLTTPLENGWQISIARELEPTQETDLRNQGKFFAEVHEDALDKLTMLIQQVGSMFRLALRKPSNIANWYDALGNYIRNLRDPRDPQDAATKNYADTLSAGNTSHTDLLFSRTIRTPEAIPSLPSIEQRKNKIVGMDNDGNPIMLIPESGSAADVLLELASSSDGKGDALIAVKQPKPNTITRTQHDFNADFINVKDFGAKGDWNATTLTGTDDTAAFQAAIDDLGNTYRNGGIRQIRVPAGTYNVGHIVIPGSLVFGLEFVGDGIMSTHIRSAKSDENPLFKCEIEYVRFRDISFYGSVTDADFSTPANWKQTCYFGKLSSNAADLDVSFISCKFSMFVDAIEAHGRGVVTQNCIFAAVTNELHIVADPDIVWVAGSTTNSQYTGARHYTRIGGRSDATSRVLKISGTATWKDYIHDVLIANNDFAVVDRLIDATDATIRRLIVANNNSILSFRGGVIEAKALNIFNISDNCFNSAYDDTLNPTTASECIRYLIFGANSLFAGVINGNTLKALRTNLVESTSGQGLNITNNILPNAWTLPENTNHYVYFSGSNCPGLIIEGNNFQASSTSGSYHLFSTAQTDKTTRIGMNSAPWSWATESLAYTPVVVSTSGTWTNTGKYTIDNGYCFVNFMVIGTSVSDTTGNIAISLPIPAVSLSGASSYSGGGEVHQLNGFTNTGASILSLSVIRGNQATVTRITNLVSTTLNWTDRGNSTVSISGTMKYKI